MPSLGNDLAIIRKELDLTIEDIHKATKIPIHILHSIEDDSIFDDLNQNVTYIRSFVRNFAKELDIEEELIIRALDQVERGAYSGLLREDSDSGPSSKFQGIHKERDPSDPIHPAEEETAEESDIFEEPSAPEPKQHRSETIHESSDTPTIQSVDWVDMGRRFTPLRSQSRLWVGALILVVAVISVAGIIYFFNQNTTSEPSPQENAPLTTTDAIEPDSLQLDLSSPSGSDDTVRNEQIGPAETLSDTLNLVIYAAYEKLEPVRVYTDVMASLNPYWIELGEAVRFRFVNTIRIRGPYQRMVLLLNGHVIENFTDRFLNQESGLVEINREVFEGESKWLQPPPDSLGLDVPDPTVIKDQPIFN